MLRGPSYRTNQPQGFTIVELLIVVVVIAILAAITIVSFNGIQGRANDTSVRADLRNYSQKITGYFSEFNTYPAASAGGLGSLGLSVSTGSYGAPYMTSGNGYNFLYCYNNTTQSFAIIAGSKSGKVFVAKNGSIAEGAWGSGSTGTCSDNGVVTTPSTNSWLYGELGSNSWATWVQTK